MHIHGDTRARNECPGIDTDTTTGDPIDPIDVSLTTTGDTSAASGLSLERFLVADANGRIDDHRSVVVPKDVAKNLAHLHIVVHGADLPGDADASSLSSLFEATLPVACGGMEQATR